MFPQPNLSGAFTGSTFRPMDRPQYNLRGIGLHRDQVDLLRFRTGSLFAATLTLTLVLIAIFP